MAQEFIIGRQGNQTFPIADTYQGVSRKHARLTIADDGQWWIENISGAKGNGVYLKTGPDRFERVEKRRISEDTIIRLGEGTHLSYTFMAHRVIGRPGDYSYEFQALRKRFSQYKQAMQDLEDENKKRQKTVVNIRIYSMVIGVVLTVIMCLNKVNLMGASPLIFCSLIATMAGQAFGPKPDKMRKLSQIRQAEFVCPVCGNPMTDMAINNLRCQACKSC